MKLVRALMEAPNQQSLDLEVSDVRLGLGYTAVKVEDGGVGTALTMGKEGARGCQVFKGKWPLAGRPAGELLALLREDDLLLRAVGLACMNALCNRPTKVSQGPHQPKASQGPHEPKASQGPHEPDVRRGDVLESVGIRGGKQDRAVMIGRFGPLLTPLRSRVQRLDVFDRPRSQTADTGTDPDALDALRRADVALVSATTLINGTLDEVLDAASGCREVVLLGASTPMAPTAFAGTPVTWLSGVWVQDGPGVLQVVSEGGGMMRFKPFVQKFNISLKGSPSA